MITTCISLYTHTHTQNDYYMYVYAHTQSNYRYNNYMHDNNYHVQCQLHLIHIWSFCDQGYLLYSVMEEGLIITDLTFLHRVMFLLISVVIINLRSHHQQDRWYHSLRTKHPSKEACVCPFSFTSYSFIHSFYVSGKCCKIQIRKSDLCI